MPAAAPRWAEVTPSQFAHEAEGLAIVRRLLPASPPFRAWSNFEFRDGHGKWHEVDLLVLGRRRLHLVELKYYAGTLRGDDQLWLRDGHRAEDSPLKLARRKAQRLSSRLRDELVRWAQEHRQQIPDPRDVVPYVQESVFLHHPGLRCMLPASSRLDLFGLDGKAHDTGLPGISERLLEPPTPQQAVGPNKDQILAALLARIGVVQRRQREVGTWVIDEEPLGEGEGWQDWPAFHRVATADRARIRFLVAAPGARSEERTRVRRIAEHEYRIMSGLTHDGLLRPRDMVDDHLGVGLVYPLDERYQRLDLWLAEQAKGVPVAQQLSVLRQTAETVAYAHRHRVVHRGLTPRSVYVRVLPDRGLRVQVGDWQAAGTVGGAQLSGLAGSGVTSLGASVESAGEDSEAAARLAAILNPAGADPDRRQAEAFQAPEGVWNRGADRVRLDVFALGALAYYLLTGRAPATSRSALRERLGRDGGLDLAADLPQVPSAVRTLVLEATRPAVSERLPDVRAFLERLSDAERALAAPEDIEALDPLEAAPGAVLGGRYRLERRLGAGSTAVGLLVTDLAAGTEGPDAQRVLKVAVDDTAETRLDAEARVLRGLRHPRLVRLVDGPVDIGGRRALVLESAGDETLGDVLRSRARLSLDLLERWGCDLLEALVALDRAGVDHRDIKPANLAVREGRGDRVKHLVLFDFSLARAGATALGAGTPPYLDPFLEAPDRGRYDSAAERYAAAVVLFEMATGSTPVYGDGLSNPAVVPDEPTVTEALFDPSVAPALVPFFRASLARRAADRYDTAADMLAAWHAVFAPVPRTVPDDADERAAAAGPQTPLAEAGLSARALSALEPYGVVTVADLVAIDPVRLNRLSGTAEPTRREVKERARRWRDRLATAVTGRGAEAPAPMPSGTGLPDPRSAAHLLAGKAGTARAEARRHAARLLLGLEPGIDAFAAQGELGVALHVTRVRGAQYVAQLQDAWAADAACRGVLDAVALVARAALADLGGVATVDELADAVLAGLPPDQGSAGDGDPAPGRLAAGLLRLALDRADALGRAEAGAEPLARRRRSGRIALLATDPALLDAAEAVAAAADEIVSRATAAAEPVVPVGRAAGQLQAALSRAARGGEDGRGAAVTLDDARLLRLAAALSRTVALSGHGELHDRAMPAAAALRLALAGVGAAQAVTAQEIRDRVRARFPALPPLPDRPRLDALLAEAGLPLVHDDDRRAYRAPTVVGDTTGLARRPSTHVGVPAADSLVAGGHIGHRLGESVATRSFLAIGVEATRLDATIDRLRQRYGAAVIDVTQVLLDAMREQATQAGLPWELARAADTAQPGSREAAGLAVLVQRALPVVDGAIEAACASAPEGGRPILLAEVAPLARYGHLGTLSRWTDLTTHRAQAIWLLVPQLIGTQGAVVDGRPLPLAAPGQFLRLDAGWLAAEPDSATLVEGARP